MSLQIDVREVKTEDLKDIDLDLVNLEVAPPDFEPQRQYYFMARCRKHVLAESKKLGRPLTYAAITFGCQMNARDSEKLEGILEAMGFEGTDTERADFVLYNTCTVRDNANQKVFGRLGYVQTLKKKNPNMMVALCGCMMQEKSAVEQIRKSYRFVDFIFGTHNIFKLAELLYGQIQGRGGMVVDVWDHAEEIVEELPARRKYPFKSGVNIMFGCDNFCSYCIVPYVRGRERSRKPGDILEEVRKLADDGVVEVMLLGQNVNSYGRNLDPPMTFAQLLRMVNEVRGIRRIRFMTSHPKDLSDDLIAAMRDCPKVCRHLHLPLQSGSTRLLQAMNRRYTKEQYLALVDRLREAVPGLSLTTDIIVGFPGETEEDFEDTLDVVRKARYDSAFTFLYSKRAGTPAASMEGQVPETVAKRRFDRLLKEVQQISAQVCRRDLGSVQEVLVEGMDSHQGGYVTGRMANNLLVHFPGDASCVGKILPVRLTEARGFYYMGTLVKEKEDF